MNASWESPPQGSSLLIRRVADRSPGRARSGPHPRLSPRPRPRASRTRRPSPCHCRRHPAPFSVPLTMPRNARRGTRRMSGHAARRGLRRFPRRRPVAFHNADRGPRAASPCSARSSAPPSRRRPYDVRGAGRDTFPAPAVRRWRRCPPGSATSAAAGSRRTSGDAHEAVIRNANTMPHLRKSRLFSAPTSHTPRNPHKEKILESRTRCRSNSRTM